LIRLTHALKCIMTLKEYQSGRVNSAKQDSLCKFISLLAFICADGTVPPLTLIYKGDSGDLQDTWVEDIEASDEAYFGVSSTG
jgi:hypothetical protein